MNIIFILVGLFAIAGAIFNWDWFMNSRKARFIVKIFTRTGARIFYLFLGSGIIVLGILFQFGVIKN